MIFLPHFPLSTGQNFQIHFHHCILHCVLHLSSLHCCGFIIGNHRVQSSRTCRSYRNKLQTVPIKKLPFLTVAFLLPFHIIVCWSNQRTKFLGGCCWTSQRLRNRMCNLQKVPVAIKPTLLQSQPSINPFAAWILQYSAGQLLVNPVWKVTCSSGSGSTEGKAAQNEKP